MRRCISCLDTKDETAFNREHDIPQAYGRFEDNLVLDCVCKDCNDYFSKELDLKLARDTVEGMERAKAGLLKPSDFKTLGKRSTTRVQFAKEGPLQGAWGIHTVDPSGEAVVVAPLPQVGYSASPDGPIEWFLADALPGKEVVGEKLGLKKGDRVCIRVEGLNREKAQEALAAMGYDPPDDVAERPPISGPVRAETVGVIAEPEFRAVTKIAMNYLTAIAGAEGGPGMMPHFNEARRYVRNAVKPMDKIVVGVDLNPWSVTKGQTDVRTAGHYVSAQAVGQFVVALVSLLMRLRYVLVLARGGFFMPLSVGSGHLFDVTSRRAVPGPPLPLRPGSPS